MPETLRMWVEIVFNISYLVVIWGLVLVLLRKRGSVSSGKLRLANLTILAFGLLAFGDTGHVGFRVMAYAVGGLDSTLPLAGLNLTYVGVGALMTAITVTLFYVVMLFMWRERFHKSFGWFEVSLILAAIVRLVLMSLPANSWNSIVPPQPFSVIRNLPLIYSGLGIAFLILRDAIRAGDKTFKWIGVMILVSYACYAPVILFVQQAPLLGMLMIPKTLAYVAIGFILYRDITHAVDKNREQVERRAAINSI